jgi:alpha-mannosidase
LGDATFTQRVTLYANSEGVDLDTLVDWNLKWCTVKCFFEVAGDPQESIAEVAYGTIHRSLYPTANHDKPRWENHMQTFLTIPAQDNSFCFNILNTGKYGFDNIEGNKIGITMIRSPMYTDLPAESCLKQERAVRAEAGLGEVPEHTDLGHHLIRLRLMPRRGAWEDQHVERDAHALKCPAFSRPITYAPLMTPAIIAASDGIEVTSFKPAEEANEHLEDWENETGEVDMQVRVLRVYETLGTAHEGTVTITKLNVSRVQPADLLERSAGDDIPLDYNEEETKTTFTAQWAPHEIKTFLLCK